MLIMQLVAPPPASTGFTAALSGLRSSLRRSHAPDPEITGRAKAHAIALTTEAKESILADFARLYLGPARGIEKVELDSSQDSGQKIVVYVSDWNGIINIPSVFQGLEVSFTQFVPPGAIWQL